MPATNLATDKDFAALPLTDKFAYLHDTDPDFKTLSPADQQAYVNHITKAPGAPEATPARTQFEEARKNDSNTPWKDTLKGFGEGALQPVSTVSKLINKIPKVGETLAPSQGVGALDKISTPVTPGEKLGAREANAVSILMPMTEGLSEAHAAGKLIPWAARGAGTLAKSVLGAAGGGYLGREVGGLVGQEKLGEQLGGLAGGLYGGYKGVKGEPLEIPSKFGLLKRAAEGGEEKPPIPMGQSTPAAPPVMSEKPFELTPPSAERSAPIQDTLHFPKPMGASETAATPKTIGPLEPPKPSPMKQMGQQIEEAAGGKPRLPNVPLREQLDRATPSPKLEPQPSVGQKVSDVLNQNIEQEAVRPLSAGPQKGMKLKDIAAQGAPEEPQAHRAVVTHEGKTFGMEAANGNKMYEATKGNTELARDIHMLKYPEVRNAFMNAGGDVNKVGLEGQRFKVGNSGNSERVQMFDWMHDQGFKPEEIVKMARQPLVTAP
jgi:hypothetical protein